MNFFNWLTEKSHAAVTYVTETTANTTAYLQDIYAQVKSGFTFVYQQAPSPYQYINFTQLWEGVKLPLNPAHAFRLIFNDLPNTRKVLWQTFSAYTLYALSYGIVYEAGIKRVLPSLPFFKNTYPEKGLEIAADFYFMRKAWRINIDNIFRHSALTKAITEENPYPHAACSCGGDSVVVTRGNIESILYYFSKIGTAKIVAKFIPFFGDIVLTQALGECFLEYPLDKMCTKHRFRKLAENNWFSFGMGLSFMLLCKFYSAMVREMTGVERDYINEAIFAMLFQYFIMVALLIDKPYPGKEPGPEVFFDGHGVVERRIKQGTQVVLKCLQNTSTQNMMVPIYHGINAFPLTHWVKKLIFENDYHSLERFTKSEAMVLFLDLRGDDIQAFLEWLIKVRNLPLAKQVGFVLQYVPSFLLSYEVKKVVKLVLEEDRLDNIIKAVLHFIEVARIKITIIDAKALKDFAKFLPHPHPEMEKPKVEERLAPNKELETPLVIVHHADLKEEQTSLGNIIIDDYFMRAPASKPEQTEKPKALFSDNLIIEEYDSNKQRRDNLGSDWVQLPRDERAANKKSELIVNSLFVPKKKIDTPAKTALHYLGKQFKGMMG